MTKTEKFLERIGLAPDTKIEHTYEFLKLIQYNCVISIAYENLNLLDKRPLSLNSDDLFEKIVEKGRGGYCFEVNGLLSWFLKEVGFEVNEHFARFLRGENDVPMRRHRIVSVKCDNGVYICDIGVGQRAPRYPIKLEEGIVQPQFDEQYSFKKDKELGWVLYDYHKGKWEEYISFTEEKVYEIDFVQPSFYCENHPDSVFTKEPMLAIKTPDGRKTIDGKVYKEFVGDDIVHIEENISNARFNELLIEVFNIKNYTI